jgi:hypothetical protein
MLPLKQIEGEKSNIFNIYKVIEYKQQQDL